ncbi:hypothetical protein CEP52_006359 [Fusarium oligoseptatum]|uniref:acetyl-CoA C-acyltransferase n=1 Tax=Fusarium oligoseptatum TaxID=2604345 RepID=A0A428TT75_9HYPO|nr:hypothetical protein CEP52_006359 [Fusarium oligoseptatum]
MSAAAQRLGQLSQQLETSGQRAKNALLEAKPSDVVITVAVRTALTKARKGYLKDTPLEGLLEPLLKNVREKAGFDPTLVEEIVVGNVLHKDAPFVTRASAIAAGYPPTTAISTVSRWCSSGLLAVESVANKIAAGSIDIGVAVGAESMSINPDNGSPDFPEEFEKNETIKDIKMPMPWTAENVAADFGVTREKQDEYAAASSQKAEHAQKSGLSSQEIVPIKTTWKDPKTGESCTVVVDKDDGTRYGTTKEGLSKIRSAFPQWPPSTTTGGNASQITDGKFVKSTVVGLDPRVMGIGPALAIPKLLGKVGISKDDVDVYEINEAFASMLVYCVEHLKLDPSRVNPRGGAIAIGHPLGCTGARQIVTALAELKERGSRIAVTSMCIGSGMGMASLIVLEQ